MNIADLIDPDLLARRVEEGYISVQRHPTRDLVIHNYTHAAQYDRVWDDATTQCRGLICEPDGTVVARPFRKFFNFGEHEADALDLHAPASVTDKLDGSLGILYPTPRPLTSAPWLAKPGWAIATRGSFTSDQAIHATKVLRTRYADFAPTAGLTYLFEIIYPENRIVVDYAGADDLYLLEVLDTETGWPTVEPDGWPGPRCQSFSYRSLADALAAEPRPNAEGYVVRLLGTDVRVKLKQEDYVALHRIVTGLNERVVWERLRDGATVDDVKEPLPEEFHDWVDDVYVGLQFEADRIWYAARDAHAELVTSVSLSGNRDWTRKDFAIAAQDPRYDDVRPYVFLLLDGKDIRPNIWRTLRPATNSGPRAVEEAAS